MEPNFVANKSIWSEYGGRITLCVLLCWLIVPIFLIIYMIIKAKRFRLEFYDQRVVMRSGVFNTEEKQALLTNIIGVRISRSLGGNLFNYGDVFVDIVGHWNIDTTAIKYPKQLKAFLESLITKQNPAGMQQIIVN